MNKSLLLAVCLCTVMFLCSCVSDSAGTAENVVQETKGSTSLTSEAEETTSDAVTEAQSYEEEATVKTETEATQKSVLDSASTGEKNALKAAQKYLNVMPFSHDGLVDQLEYEGYSNSEAVYGADNCGADWNEQAEKSAAKYLSIMPFSRQGLIDQLVYEGFTQSQAEYGVDSCMGTDSDALSNDGSSSPTTGEQNALKAAQKYLNVMPFSYDGLVDQLEYEGYSHSEAVYGVDNCDADWDEQAEKSAAKYLSIMPFSRQGLIDQLEYEGFTHSQAVHGAEANGY